MFPIIRSPLGSLEFIISSHGNRRQLVRCQINEFCVERLKVFTRFFAFIFPSRVSEARLGFFDKLTFLSLIGQLTLFFFFYFFEIRFRFK